MPSGYLVQDTDDYLMPVLSPTGVDMWLDQDVDGFLMPLAAELTPTFPSEDDTTTRAGAYGWTGEYTPNFTFPNTGQVLQLINFGAHGTEFQGTLVAGTIPAPAIPVVIATNAGDGISATVIIQGADVGTTNRVYCQPIGHFQNPSYVGSVAGNGTLTIYPGYPATYMVYVLSTIGNSLTAVGVSAYFELVGRNAMRDELANGPALAHLAVCQSLGVQIAFQNTASDPWVTIWALDVDGRDYATVHGGQTSYKTAKFEVPLQAGWPPSKINVQATFRIPATATTQDAIYGIENHTTINANIGITPVHEVILKRLDYDTRIGG